MSDTDREYLRAKVVERWGDERAEADAAIIESASAALARIASLQPAATVELDIVEEADRG